MSGKLTTKRFEFYKPDARYALEIVRYKESDNYEYYIYHYNEVYVGEIFKGKSDNWHLVLDRTYVICASRYIAELILAGIVLNLNC